ncbi:MAG: MBL fold metallo-hydrolase [Muribaculaceae bacterium]|nr:MBL fold metallo-hydrolase [Muribaculaceae bacterium]
MSRRRQQRRREAFWNDQPGLFDVVADNDTDAAIEPLSDEAVQVSDRLRFISFGSGSSGNCAYIGCDAGGLLIDAGVDNNYVEAVLGANSIDPDSIQGILLTHDHGDHVRYAYALLRRHRHMRLYATMKSFNGLLRRHSMSRRVKDYHTPIYKEFPFTVGPLSVTAFETSHDGSDNVGFAIDALDENFVVLTDTGKITERADYYIRRAKHLMIETNYDLNMLRNGLYPRYLKARIESEIGHLDNAVTARYLADVASEVSLRNIFLCHLSQDNNTPQIALDTVKAALVEAGIDLADSNAFVDDKLRLAVLPRSEASALVILSKRS